jgi:cell filamentation protein
VANYLFPDSIEPEHYPNSSVFVNLLDITDSKLLREKEAAFTMLRTYELLQQTDILPQTFDFSHLKSIHHYLFQDLYGWAGCPRNYDVKKGADIFTPAAELPKYEKKVFAGAAAFSEKTSRPSRNEAAITLARSLGIINIYHPFPEGNGRTQRVFISSLAKQFNYSINWNKVAPWEMVETSKQAHNDPITDFV